MSSCQLSAISSQFTVSRSIGSAKEAPEYQKNKDIKTRRSLMSFFLSVQSDVKYRMTDGMLGLSAREKFLFFGEQIGNGVGADIGDHHLIQHVD